MKTFLSLSKFVKPALLSATVVTLATFQSPATHAAPLGAALVQNLSSYTLVAADAAEQKAVSFITNASGQGLEFLADTSLTDAQKKAKFRTFLKSNFDLRAIGRFALGRYWRTATPAQQTKYLKLFEDMIIGVYSNRFSEYSGQSVEVMDAEKRGKSDIIVHSKITGNDSPEIKLDWRVREKNGRMRVIDVMVEGVSMAVTQRSDFASVIQRGGGDIGVLLAHLENN